MQKEDSLLFCILQHRSQHPLILKYTCLLFVHVAINKIMFWLRFLKIIIKINNKNNNKKHQTTTTETIWVWHSLLTYKLNINGKLMKNALGNKPVIY
jgi:hypothetical protein